MPSEIKDKLPISESEILNDIKTKPTVPIWPHYAWAHNCCRHKAYETARRGGEEFIYVGGDPKKRKMIRVVTSVLRKKLGLETANA
jgi:hypothetical protein